MPNEIEAVVRKFDFDGKLAADCAEVLTLIDDDVPANCCNLLGILGERCTNLLNWKTQTFKAEMVARTAKFIGNNDWAMRRGNSWRRGLLAAGDRCLQTRHTVVRRPWLRRREAKHAYYHRFLAVKMDRTSPDYLRLVKAIMDFTTTELAIMSACYAHYQNASNAGEQRDFTSQFENDISLDRCRYFRSGQYSARNKPPAAVRSRRAC